MSEAAPLEKQVTTKSGAASATMTGAVIAAIAASSCCVLPTVLALIGVSGAGAAARLEAWRPLFLGLAAGLVGLGFYLAYRRKPRQSDAVDCACPAPRTRSFGKLALWFGAALVALLAAYPYLAGLGAQTEQTGDTSLSATSRRTVLQIEGMTCEGCVTKIVSALGKTPGVVKASVEFEEGLAFVTYDPAMVSPESLAKIVSRIDGYSAEASR
jgi:copper chaperone CopZ